MSGGRRPPAAAAALGDIAVQRATIATVYAGELEAESLERLHRQHMQLFVLDGLLRETNARRGIGNSGAKALGLLAEVHGLLPVRKRKIGQGG